MHDEWKRNKGDCKKENITLHLVQRVRNVWETILHIIIQLFQIDISFSMFKVYSQFSRSATKSISLAPQFHQMINDKKKICFDQFLFFWPWWNWCSNFKDFGVKNSSNWIFRSKQLKKKLFFILKIRSWKKSKMH